MIKAIQPTSKASLKVQCLVASNGDIEKAEKLYNFMSKDMDELPTFDVIPPTTMQKLKEGATQTFAWINENQDTIMNWISIIRQMVGKGGSNVPPIGGAPVQPVPSIN